MGQVNQLLLFPGRLLQARERCSTSQKAVALSVGMDQAFFCGVEKGRRPPFTDRVLGQLAALLKLNPGDAEALAWAAKHDRCIRSVWQLTESEEETRLVSQLLSTAHWLDGAQRTGLLAYLESLQESATRLAKLSKEGVGMRHK
jgi:hypothetical protein